MAAERMLTIVDYLCWFQVEVSEPDQLEFILKDAARRADRDDTYYTDVLHDMLSDEFFAETTRIVECECYGSVKFQLLYDNPKDLPKILERCSNTIKTWAKRYNVNQMKRD